MFGALPWLQAQLKRMRQGPVSCVFSTAAAAELRHC
jgi:hypothetical protein